MIVENDQIPMCRDHGLRVTRCVPCAERIAAFEKTLVKVTASAWRADYESAMDYHARVDRAEEENRARLHSWAVANVYVDERLPF